MRRFTRTSIYIPAEFIIEVSPMKIYQAVWTALFLSAVLSYGEGQVCRDHVNVTISINPAFAEQDVVHLTCIISGVDQTELEYYWWLLHETNLLLYTYSDIYHIDEINNDYEGLVINASHSTSAKGHISSTIAIRHRAMHNELYRCEFVLKDYSICARTIRVDNSEMNKRHIMVNDQGEILADKFSDKKFSSPAVSSGSTDVRFPPSPIEKSWWLIPSFQNPYNLSRTFDGAMSIFYPSPPTSIQSSILMIFVIVVAIGFFIVALAILFILVLIYRRIQRVLQREPTSPERTKLVANAADV